MSSGAGSSVKPRKGARVVYVNFYPNGIATWWETKEIADRQATSERIACVPVVAEL